MTSVIHILGTDHRFQTKSSDFSSESHEAFSMFVRELVAQHRILAIAEECHPQALAEVGVERSVPECVARELGIAHRHCDPDKKTRVSLGILQENDIRISQFPKKLSEVEVQERVKSSHRTREEFWLHQLLDINTWPALFVCGANDVESFTGVLRNSGLQPEIAARNWGT